MATYIDKIKYNNNITYKLIDSGASHNTEGILIGTTGDFKSNGTIAAEQGIFNKLIATSANISTLDVNNLTAVNATVVGLLDVQGEMHTKSWSNSNIATIDGSFYITPTSVSADGSDPTVSGYTPTGTITYSSGNYTEMTITGTFDTSQVTLDGTSSIAWPANSYVIITGEVSFGNKEWYPLGTIRGKLKSQIAASNASKTFTIIPIGSRIISGEVGDVSLTDGNGHKPTTLEAIRTAISNTSGASLNSLKLRKVKISMTSRANGSDQYALGIYMTAMGSNGKTFLDIYGGSEKNNTNTSIVISGTTYQSGALAKPKVRIGNLLGLPALTLPNGTSVNPTGWGIYTNNGFFEGTIVSQQGKIGNFTLGTAIYGAASGTGPSSISATTAGTYLGTDGFRSNKSGDTTIYVQITNGVITAKGAKISGAITASEGQIGPWFINASSISRNSGGTAAGSYNTASNMYFGTSGISLGTTFRVSSAGALTATSGSIGGWNISANALCSATTYTPASGRILLAPAGVTTSSAVGNLPAATYAITAGSDFGVTTAGKLYATGAEISGKITASSLTIGSGATVSGLSTSNISGIDNYALQSSLDTEVAQRKAVYAISTTGATTAAKTTESGTPSGFVLYNGATVTVKFNNANSTTTPTLNVNGTGAKTIKSYTGAALTAAEYTWPAGAAITFTYDGSYWRMQDSGALQAKADAAASASSASSSASAASNSASSASTSASNASNSATSASNSASTASTKATEASNSASTASSKASAASTSATNAANSASAASTSATNASNSADAAASSASDASDSADAAAGSASTASSKATAASNSATAASNSASSASSSATSASNSASSASSSATTATNKANAASESATNAANSATAASGSATSAANSATAASNSATSASNSATAASNSATAAAEVMGGFTVLWNYSAFGTATAGDAFICGFDPAIGTKSDGNGWIKWNSAKRTITKQQVNPGTIVPYNIPIYIVCRLSSATATTGTNYMVWYNAGWKYAACPSPTAVGGSWTWTDNRDIILGSFVETGANEVLTECELFNPPWTSKQITTNTTTPTSYIMDTDSNKGITVKPKDSSGNDFLQMNSTAIEFFRNSTTASAMRLTDNSFRLGLEASNHTTIDTNGLHIWTGTESTATNEVALFSSTARIGKTNNSRFLLNADSLQAFNSSNTKYFEVSSNGMTYGSNTVASTSYADGKASAAQAAAQTAAQGYADIAEANASYSVEIQVTAIDYVNNSATLVAIPYYQGSTTMPTGVTLSYQWYKNGTALANTSTAPTIAGATTNTLQLGEGTDFGSSTTNAIYTCIIS